MHNSKKTVCKIKTVQKQLALARHAEFMPDKMTIYAVTENNITP
jgi:hypothetical protein